jgi:hypothetical protein
LKHYCRYCSHCVGQDGGIGWCEHRNEMVNKKSIRNACNDFDFCEIDAFYFDRSDNPEDAKYKPREAKIKECDGQLSLFGC